MSPASATTLAAAAALTFCLGATARQKLAPHPPAFLGPGTLGSPAISQTVPRPAITPQPSGGAWASELSGGPPQSRMAMCIGVLGAAAAAKSLVVCRAKGGKGRRKGAPKWPKPEWLGVWRELYWKSRNMGMRIGKGPGQRSTLHWPAEPVRWCKRMKNRIRIRHAVEGTCARPRMAVFRSKHHFHVNFVDDTVGLGEVLFTVTTKQKDVFEEVKKAQNGVEKTWSFEAAEVIGKMCAQKALEKNITTVAFDRGGFAYVTKIKALAEAARSGGLQF